MSVILMLEDDADRVRRFRRVLKRIAPEHELHLWRDAWIMIREMELWFADVAIISLDHDLEPETDDSPDPGTGWDLTQVLAPMTPLCPIIIHTSNAERASWMMGEFDLGGWEYHRIPPLGDDWIEHDWRRLVRRLLHSK